MRPELCVNASTGRDGHCGLNPARNSTFEFIEGLVGELAAPTTKNGSEHAALFPERFFHFGGCVCLAAEHALHCGCMCVHLSGD